MSLAVPKPPRPPAASVLSPPTLDLEQAYQKSVVPLLDQFDRRNAAAADRAIAALHDRINVHRAGIAPFTHDIASWGTRFGVLRRYSSDLWQRWRHHNPSAGSVSAYVNEKFRRHILSEDGLKQDVALVLDQFTDDMAASRNRLYAELALPLKEIKTAAPSLNISDEEFRNQVQQRAGRMAGMLAPDTLISGLAAVAGGWVAADVAQSITSRIVAQILTRLGTVMAAEGIEAGGATAGAGAIGGGAGSFGGPIGAIIGIGVGLVIGAIVDWRMSKKFEAKVSQQCNRFLDAVEQRLRDGSAGSPGLRASLEQTVTLTDRAQRQAIHDALEEQHP